MANHFYSRKKAQEDAKNYGFIVGADDLAEIFQNSTVRNKTPRAQIIFCDK